MQIRPNLSLSVKQKSAPKALMRQLIKLLPLNDVQLEEIIKKELQENPFLQFETSRSTADIASFDINEDEINTPSIYKILTPQIEVIFKDEKVKKTAYEILALLDEDGFLREPINNMDNEKYSVLQQLQKLQPVGVFSRNLMEFYSAYLYATDQLNQQWEILLNSLHEIASGQTQNIIQELGSAEIYEMLMDKLKLLPTQPDIPSALSNHITPDLIVEKQKNNFKVALNSNIHKSLNIDNKYVSDLRDGNIKSSDKKFITEKFSSAKWLKTAVVMRAENLLKIGTVIISKQNEFMNGDDLNPLTLNDVAMESGLHISTVSRIVNNKYFLYNGKNIELKKMFCSKAHGDISQAKIMNRLIKLIENEKNTKIILSDEDIVKELQKQDIKISRRTVAKYRKICKIGSSRQRKAK